MEVYYYYLQLDIIYVYIYTLIYTIYIKLYNVIIIINPLYIGFYLLRLNAKKISRLKKIC